MSGICGIVNRNSEPVDRQLLTTLTDFMTFRGPDAQQVWADGPVGFGHTLLRTTFEAEHEQQPCSLDGRVWITADARIDGQKDLKRKLAGKGRHGLDGITDAELVLHAYHAWGEECLQHLLGDFAFAIWDGPEHRLFCARDHFGVKPFYYAYIGDTFLFSNTLNCLRRHPAVSATLNDRAIGDFLLFDYNYEPTTTTFADIQRLPAAHVLFWSNEILQVKRYWTLPIPELIHFRHASDYVDQFNMLLRDTVKDRLRTDRINVSMSGGLDSSAVAATAHSLLKEEGRPFDLRSHTVVYDELIPDRERYYAGLVAERLGLPIRFLPADAYQLYERQEDPILRRPEPVHTPDLAFWSDELQSLSDQNRVVMTGWDGDAILAEPPRPYLYSLVKNLQVMQLASKLSWLFLKKRGLVQKFFINRLRQIRNTTNKNPWEGYPAWLNESFAKCQELRARWIDVNTAMNTLHPTRPCAVRILTSPYLWLDLFEGYDAGVNKFLLEFRHPLLDLRLIEFCLSLPPIPWCSDKELLRTSMRDSLPSDVLRRPKEPLAGFPYMKKLQQPTPWVGNFHPVPGITQYVDHRLVPKLSGGTDYLTTWINMRPFSLNHWLMHFIQTE